MTADERVARECPNCGVLVPWNESHYSGTPAFGYQCERPASLPPAPPTLCPCVEQERPVCGDRCWHFGNEYPPCRLCGAPDRAVASLPPAPPTLSDGEVAAIRESVGLGSTISRREVVALCDTVAALRAEVARLASENARTRTLYVLRGKVVAGFDSVARCVEALRESIEQASGPGLPLHDALIGQRSDSTFWTQWERNKDRLRELLNAIDEAFPIAQTMSSAARSSAAGEDTDG